MGKETIKIVVHLYRQWKLCISLFQHLGLQNGIAVRVRLVRTCMLRKSSWYSQCPPDHTVILPVRMSSSKSSNGFMKKQTRERPIKQMAETQRDANSRRGEMLEIYAVQVASAASRPLPSFPTGCLLIAKLLMMTGTQSDIFETSVPSSITKEEQAANGKHQCWQNTCWFHRH